MEITDLLHEWRDGNDEAGAQLFAVTYQELRNIAQTALAREFNRNKIDPAELLHEGLILLLGAQQIDWTDRAHFKAVAATCIRRALIDQARRWNSQKRDGEHVTLQTKFEVTQSNERYSIERIHDAIEALSSIDPNRAKVVELKYFGGLTNDEVAESMSISASTVKRYWRSSRAWLQQELNPRSD